jgi:hypothetical protein
MKSIIAKRSDKQELLMRAEVRFGRRKIEVVIRLVGCHRALRKAFIALRRVFLLAALIVTKRIWGL